MQGGTELIYCARDIDTAIRNKEIKSHRFQAPTLISRVGMVDVSLDLLTEIQVRRIQGR